MARALTHRKDECSDRIMSMIASRNSSTSLATPLDSPVKSLANRSDAFSYTSPTDLPRGATILCGSYRVKSIQLPFYSRVFPFASLPQKV
ncbi:hypothetical protein ED733_006254 [Metarhizium rileyi]|uniref:Uncharacterized protein n=1 Tax=Metarhizium rileyi (strain RCEF 4871) TaxID=1649241 RepID=A0A5C6GAM1_METRR|nr:hypothetical protein ED733_006254 [Metarhizium rileyi]